jgi:hypothetical protein
MLADAPFSIILFSGMADLCNAKQLDRRGPASEAHSRSGIAIPIPSVRQLQSLIDFLTGTHRPSHLDCSAIIRSAWRIR